MPQHSDDRLSRILESPSYRVAYRDVDFLARPELRAARLELELLKPEIYLREHNIRSTIVVFGSTQIIERSAAQRRLDDAQARLAQSPDDPRAVRDVIRAKNLLERSRFYDAAREFARLVSAACQTNHERDYVIVTGGGPGIMEAANRGASDVGAKSVGLNIRLPHEQQPNPYITPDLCFQFHYFAMRKLHFLLRAKALVAFPGGFGTLDELFDALTLRQTGRMQAIPIILFGREYWRHVVDLDFLADQGTIADQDLQLLDFAETADEAWAIIQRGVRGDS
ncbi:MAG: LOG family protein [Planctomycetaceae bacterium]|nr:LOG family protein [Planctomycetaceae bacterium]